MACFDAFTHVPFLDCLISSFESSLELQGDYLADSYAAQCVYRLVRLVVLPDRVTLKPVAWVKVRKL